MTDTYDDLDDLDKVWYQDDPVLSQDVEVDFGFGDRPVFDGDPVVDDRLETAEEFAAHGEFDDEPNVIALPGRDRFRGARMSRRKTTTLLHASTITIMAGIGAVGVMLSLVILRGPALRFWDGFAMDWKMHVGWMTPFLATAVAFVALRYGERLRADFQVRKMLTDLLVFAVATAAIAAVLGALVNIAAPNDFMHRAWSP
jgi:hypothetical protein